MIQQIIFALFNGVASGMAIFLVAAGVTLIFGVLKIVNFAHGAFFMLGAYVAFAILGEDAGSVGMLLLAALAAAAVVGACGFVTDKVVLTRIRGADDHFVLIATFALLLVVSGAIKLIWGVDYHSVSPPESLADAIEIRDLILPTYSLFIIGFGLIAFVLLDIGLHRLWIGKVLRSLVSDSWVVGLLGYNVAALYTLTVILAFALAGAAGALLLPNQSLSPSLAESYLMLGFVCCIIGGLGSVRGALIAALLLGIVESLSTAVLKGYPGLTVYVAMVLALLLRPQGFFGVAGAALSDGGGSWGGWFTRAARPARRLAPTRPARPQPAPRPRLLDLRIAEPPKEVLLTGFGAAAVVAAISLPLWANDGLTFLAGLTAIEALFALSWNLLFGYAGIVSFGHAAFFALGAYGVGLMLKAAPGVPFLGMLIVVAALGAVVATLVGAIVLRRASGIYLAILTMSLAQITQIVIGNITVLGRDDGLAAIPRPVIELGVSRIDLTSNAAYYWFILLMVGLGVALLWCLSHSAFGRVLRSIRQDPARASFIGVDIARYRLVAFVISGAIAAFAGGLQAPWTQIITPEATSLNHSVSPVLNTLLGGAGSFWGPMVGAAAFAVVGFATRTFAGLSDILTGSILLIVVLAAPRGILGFLERIEAQLPFTAKADWSGARTFSRVQRRFRGLQDRDRAD